MADRVLGYGGLANTNGTRDFTGKAAAVATATPGTAPVSAIVYSERWSRNWSDAWRSFIRVPSLAFALLVR